MHSFWPTKTGSANGIGKRFHSGTMTGCKNTDLITSQGQPPRSVIEVGGLAVAAELQRSGLARELVQRLVADAKNKASPGACVVTVTWPGGISDQWAKRHLRPLGGSSVLAMSVKTTISLRP